MALGRAWTDSGYVFTSTVGTSLDPRNVQRWYAGVAGKAGLPGSWHSLRHAAASTLLVEDVSVRTVADVLGHATTRLTTDTYGHVSAEVARDAIGRLGRAIREGADQATPSV